MMNIFKGGPKRTPKGKGLQSKGQSTGGRGTAKSLVGGIKNAFGALGRSSKPSLKPNGGIKPQRAKTASSNTSRSMAKPKLPTMSPKNSPRALQSLKGKSTKSIKKR